MKEYLFVYGLFRDSGKSLLGDAISCGKASIPGKLYKVNEFYPGAIIGGDDRLPRFYSKVWGDVYLIDPSIFPTLDKYEGDEYVRRRVRSSTDLICWVYEYKYVTSKFKEIVGGDWMLR